MSTETEGPMSPEFVRFRFQNLERQAERLTELVEKIATLEVENRAERRESRQAVEAVTATVAKIDGRVKENETSLAAVLQGLPQIKEASQYVKRATLAVVGGVFSLVLLGSWFVISQGLHSMIQTTQTQSYAIPPALRP